jgi:pyruvate dehydrogenase kinase 2/3/4
VSRLYARYFGGDLNVMSSQGYGTDAYVHLRSSADTAVENVDSFN